MRYIILALILLTSCGYAPHIDPPVHTVANAEQLAIWHTAQAHGALVVVPDANSMLPTLQNGDRLVVMAFEWNDSLLGRLNSYQPSWNELPVVHRFVAGSAKDGFIASGDNAKYSEAQWRVTREQWIGEVVAVYRKKQ